MKRKFSKSQGPKGDLDPRRWVIITIRNNGAQEAQFPLPVTVNTQRVAFDRDEPVIAPAYYLDTLDNCVLPKYEEVPANAKNGMEDQARLVELKYMADVDEIDEKYQTVDTIMDFVKLVRSEECPDEYHQFKGALRLGQVSFNRHNYEWSDEVMGKIKAKEKPKPVGKTSGATASTN